jgi:CheY-like chemotaxis protein
MDIQLPGMDGLEATRRLKLRNGDRELAHAAGCAGYITKPIDKNILIQEVAAHLGYTSSSEG